METDIYARILFCTKFNAEQFLFEAFVDVMCIFGSIQPLSECIFPFQTNIIFQPYQYFKPPSSTLGGAEIHKCARELFCTKFNFEQLLFEPFFDVLCIFGSVEL